ncbi:MAG TPA: DinB family protein [Pyrinomonadaceae bacterium]|nr:DinB family protein [Pyrinomonadaceae bacterium]
MQTLEHLRHLLAYDDWANRRTLDTLRDQHSERSLQILAHILITKQEYFDRLHGKDSTGFNFWPDLTLDECAQMIAATTTNFEKLLRDADESILEQAAAYKTSEGVPFENSYRELLTHILFHSSIHRGNIVLKMREEGLEPPRIDYILFLREQV